MSNKEKSIPLRSLNPTMDKGFVLERLTPSILALSEGIQQAHRDNYHAFFILENGIASLEIDFQQYTQTAPSVMYIRPYQVHKAIEIKNATLILLLINNEHLHPEYLDILNNISHLKPIEISEKTFSILSDTVAIDHKLKEMEQEKMYPLLAKNHCNTLVGLIASQYMEQMPSSQLLSRCELLHKSFKTLLEQHFVQLKRPKEYAKLLNITVSYLNECVKKASGQSVSYHIQERIVLEGKRLLYHSSKSIKEIAFELGYEDHAYFSRVFSKVTTVSPLQFRNKNSD